ncbi:hypothetical protein XM53_17520 [Roseovarius atlanticus]|uniref:Ribbon-helix-helix protein CopG domain-containing protein n=1 Tax=Roseovarius atlanticus TaxID=1641875 RepID=A0A0T5NR01_9RHOB|nr:hypothetical protein XM53_17520 [Roseovarius atlanticus]
MTQRGRPKSDTTGVMLRLHEDMLRIIDAERERRPDMPSRPEMIRRVLAEWAEKKIQDSEK